MNSNLTQTSLKKNEESEQQTLRNIQQLQEMEKEQYAKLEANAANNVNPAEQEMIIKKINELSQIRIDLFKTLGYMYDNVQSSIANSRMDLVDQHTAVKIVENELNKAKTQLNTMETNKQNKMRMVEINTYYGKRYKAHTQLIKKIVFIAIPLIILAILNKQGLLSENIIYGLAVLILVLGGFVVIKNIIDLSSRDNMDYDAYNWRFNPENVKPTVYEYDKAQLLGASIDDQSISFGLGLDCYGSACCSDGMVYDKPTNKCIAMPMAAASAMPMAAPANAMPSIMDATPPMIATSMKEGFMGFNFMNGPQPYSREVQFATV